MTVLALLLAATGALADVTITGSGHAWAPANVTINPGETVTWNWSLFHNVAQSNGPADLVWNGTGFRSGNPVNNGTFSHLFSTPGLYYFLCEVHASTGMRGTVTVLDPCVNPTPPATQAQISYNPGTDTVTLSWDAVTQSQEGCPLTPLYRVLAGPSMYGLTEIAVTPDLFLELPAVGHVCYQVTVLPSAPAN